MLQSIYRSLITDPDQAHALRRTVLFRSARNKLRQAGTSQDVLRANAKTRYWKSLVEWVVTRRLSRNRSAMTQSRQLNHSSELGDAPHARTSRGKNCQNHLPP